MTLPYAVVALGAHGLAVLAALLSVFACRAANTPSVSTGWVSSRRLTASMMAVSLTVTLELLFAIAHPLAPSTSLLITLGFVTASRRDALTLALGITLIAWVGQATRM